MTSVHSGSPPRHRDRLVRRLAAVRRAALLRRRSLAALLAAAATAIAVHAATAPAPAQVWALTAAADLPAGRVLGADDLRRVAVPPQAVPDGLLPLDQAAGRVLAAPMRRGEPVTDARVVAPALVAAYPGLVAVPVRIPDPGAVALLRVGDRIDLLATDPQAGGTVKVATRVPVLALPDPGDSSPTGASTGLPGRLIVVATSQNVAQHVAESAVRCYLTVALSG